MSCAAINIGVKGGVFCSFFTDFSSALQLIRCTLDTQTDRGRSRDTRDSKRGRQMTQ